MMKKLLTVVVLGLSALSFNVALAHGSHGGHARHGGVVATAYDLDFELVGTPDGAALYVGNHGSPVDLSLLRGTLTVQNGAATSEAELVAAGDKLEAKGLKLEKGAQVVAALVTPSAKAITVRFVVR